MKKSGFILAFALLISGFAYSQATVTPPKGTNMKATLKPANRKIIDPNVGIVRAPIPPANEHYRANKATPAATPAVVQSAAPVKASTPLPVITSSQAKMTRAMAVPAAQKVTPAKYTGKRVTGTKPGPTITKTSAVKAAPKKLKPVVKQPQGARQKMFTSIYHH